TTARQSTSRNILSMSNEHLSGMLLWQLCDISGIVRHNLSSTPASAAQPLPLLVRQARDQIEGLQDLARLGLATKGALEDSGDLARAIYVAQGAVDVEAKVAVALR